MSPARSATARTAACGLRSWRSATRSGWPWFARLSTSGRSIVAPGRQHGITPQQWLSLQVLSKPAWRHSWVGRERLWELEEEALREARRSLESLSAQWDEARPSAG